MLETPKLNGQSMVYMYGLSDFWVDMFSDTQLVETLLEGQTVQLAEAYSYFLQRAAGISLMDIQDKYSTRIKLLLIGEEDVLPSSSDFRSFRIDSSIKNISKLSNRPILPTSTLSYGIHFDLEGDIITFHKPIGELKFPVRYRSDGSWQYAVWMSDVVVNEKWIDNSFGRLVKFTEDDAIFNYKSFLEGVYFLYTNGPNIANIERGVNLAMGMPYARETEVILDIARDEISGNWIVLTSNHSYEIPYSYRPDLSVGDTIRENDVLSTWVDIKDYSTSGAWWYQIYLPQEVLGSGVDTYSLGIASEGSIPDTMMNTFLKHHMFEVLITQPSSDETAYSTARNLVLRSKPEYTYPVFVWKASIGDEDINIVDDFTYRYLAELTDTCIAPPSIRYMDRSTDDMEFSRGISWYNRIQAPMRIATLLGIGDWIGNGGWDPRFQKVAERDRAHLAVTLRSRNDTVSPVNRNTIMRGWRDVPDENYDGMSWEILPEDVIGGSISGNIPERNLTPLYLMSSTEVEAKVRTVNSRFSLGNRTRVVVTGLNLPAVYDTWMKRESSIPDPTDSEFTFTDSEGSLDVAFSKFAYQTYVPNRSDMYDIEGSPINDGTILITKTSPSTWACQWVRTRVAKSPTVFPVEDQDHTVAIESYGTDNIGTPIIQPGVSIPSESTIVRCHRLISDASELLIISDGMYVPTSEYSVVTISSRAELIKYNPEDPDSLELDIQDRSFAILDTPPDTLGYSVYNAADLSLDVKEERLYQSNGSYTLTNPVLRKEDILVIKDGLFVFNYSVNGTSLTLDEPSSSVIVRYVTHVSEEILPAGSSVYQLSSDVYCKLFIGNQLLEDWSYTRNGIDIEFPSETIQDVIVRYEDTAIESRVSPFTRSTIEDSQSRFLMDRSRELGEYDDYMGQTAYIDRSGIPKDSEGNYINNVRSIRRLQ